MAVSILGADAPEFEECSPSNIWFMFCKVLQGRYPFIPIKAADAEEVNTQNALDDLQKQILKYEADRQ